ncbi:MAG: PAS domain-containing protein, partial [Chloroflexi bacterium]|nr:PAS domain-containing protein [Chloroflexota bacterium]
MHVANPFGRLIAPIRPDPAFVRLADECEQAVLLVSARTLQIQHANHAATLLTGYSRQELERLVLPQVCQSAALHEQLDQLERYLPPRTMLDAQLRNRAGRTLTVDLRLTRAADRPDAPLLVLAEDAGPRVQAAQSLNRMSRSLEALDALIALNIDPDETAIEHAVGLVRLYTNADSAGLYRVLPGEPGLALTARVELGPAFPERLPAQDARYLLQPETWHNNQRAEHALSQAARYAGWATLLSYPVGEASASVGVLFVGYKPGRPPPARPLLGIAARQIYLIARQVAQQQALAHITAGYQVLSQQFQAVIGQSQHAIILLGSDGCVQQINPPASDLFGYSAEEASGMAFQDLLISPQALTGPILAALHQGKSTSASHILLHSRSGEPVPTAIRVLPVAVAAAGLPATELAAGGQGALIVVTNQSQAVAVEQRTQQLEQRALVGELSAILAHEVRNPINNISANAQLLAHKLPSDSPLQEKLDEIQHDIRRLSRLMEDVLQSARPLEIARRPCSLGEVIETVLDRWAPRCARAGVAVRRELAPGLPPAMIDPRSIEQALTNLVDNALNAMPHGGTLTVTLAAAPPGPAPEANPAPAAPPRSPTAGSEGQGTTAQLQLKIADSGQGMDEETRLRVFDPFFTTRPGGTGLGLSITRHIIRTVHKGATRVDSFPDAGTIFTLLLPVAAPDTRPLSP